MKLRINRDAILMTLISLIVLCVLIYAGRIFIEASWPEAGTGEFRLTVFETSDIHGSYTLTSGDKLQYTLAYISDKVNDVRNAGGERDTGRTVLLDGGDTYQGNPSSDLLEGEAMSGIFDLMEYDAVAVGNHEFDWGLETLVDPDQTMRDYTAGGEKHDNKIPVICSNLYKDGKKSDLTRDYVILNKKASSQEDGDLNVRVAVIGFADDYSGSILESQFEDLGYSISSDFAEVNRLASDLESSDECDATILLVHGDSKRIAYELGEDTSIDLVLGGHTHNREAGATKWGLRYAEPAGKSSAFVCTELVFENDGKGGAQLRSAEEEPPEVFAYNDYQDFLFDTEENADELDRAVVDLTDEFLDRVNEQLKVEVGYITTPVVRLYIEGSSRRATTAGNFATSAIIRATGVDVAFYNGAGLRNDLKIVEGADRRIVTMGDLYAMFPFDDELYCYEMTYEELLEVFKYSLTSSGRSLLTYMSGMDCYFIEDPNDHSGGKYRRLLLDSLVKDGELIYRDGKWKEGWKDRKVRIAVTEFTAITDRGKENLHNPLCGYNDTDKLISNESPIRGSILQVLTREAEENDGLLSVDTEPHFKLKAYDGPDSLE